MDRMNPAKTMELLNELAKDAECYYLSDLHEKSRAAAVIAAVDATPLERFPLTEWREAARYILQIKDVEGEDIPGVIAFIKSRLAGD